MSGKLHIYLTRLGCGKDSVRGHMLLSSNCLVGPVTLGVRDDAPLSKLSQHCFTSTTSTTPPAAAVMAVFP